MENSLEINIKNFVVFKIKFVVRNFEKKFTEECRKMR